MRLNVLYMLQRSSDSWLLQAIYIKYCIHVIHVYAIFKCHPTTSCEDHNPLMRQMLVRKSKMCVCAPCCVELQILGLMVIRKILDMVFSQHDLAWLDDLLPEKEKKKKDDDKKGGKDKKRPKLEVSEEEVRNMSICCPLQATTDLVFLVCACIIDFQDKYSPYANHSPSSDSDLDRRYCVLKLHIPYKDLVYPDVVQSEWGAYCQPSATHQAL